MGTKQLDVASPGVELYEKVFQRFLTVLDQDQDIILSKQINYYEQLVSSFREDLDYLTINQSKHNKVSRLLESLAEDEGNFHDLDKSLHDSFMLFIVGMGNYGKSTLINALLEQPAAETDVLPKTWKIDVFRHDLPEGKAVLRFKDQIEQELTVSEARLFIEQEEKKREKSEKEIGQILRKERGNLKSKEAYDEFQIKLRREKLYVSHLIEVHWGIKNGYRLNDFHIVDTPGLTQNIMGEIQHSINTYYHKADGIIWMLDAQVIAARGTMDLVEDLKKSLATVGGEQRDNIIAILNRMDQVHKNAGQEGVQNVIQVANSIFKDYFKAILPFSAKQAFEGIMANDRELMEKSGIQQLHHQIHNQFRVNAKRIQLQKKEESMKSYGHQVNRVVEEFIEALEADYHKLKSDHQKFLDDIGRKKSEFMKQIDTVLKGYEKKVKGHISSRTSTLFDLGSMQAKEDYAKNNIFESDSISAQIKKLQEEILSQSNDFMQFYSKKLFFTEYPHLQENVHQMDIKHQIGLKIDLKHHQFNTDGFAIGSGIAGLLTSLVLGPIGLLIGVASFFGGGYLAKQSKISDLESKLNSALKKTIEDIKGKLTSMVDELLGTVEQEIIVAAMKSFNDVYGIIGQSLGLYEFMENIEDFLEISKEFSANIIGPAPDQRPALKEILLLQKKERMNVNC
ncbi:dynamin family protein [Neobacillus rhizosphaerae]|uniref:dynamin family protein n=1 Tax=Neobacillus rhizosphaerae TaxID=2880965 RepID=UPI003D26A8C4